MAEQSRRGCQVAGGVGFAAALSSGGQLWVWGKALGVRPSPIGACGGAVASRLAAAAGPVCVFSEVAAGGSALVARAADGRIFTFAGGTTCVARSNRSSAESHRCIMVAGCRHRYNELPTAVRERCKYKKKGEARLVEAGALVGTAQPASLAERCVAAIAAALARGDAAVCVQVLQLASSIDVPALSAVLPACAAAVRRAPVARLAASAGVDVERALQALSAQAGPN
jgi:hypothetical protein